MNEDVCDSINSDQVLQNPKPPVADAADHDQMFGQAKTAILFAVLDDSRGQTFADTGEGFEVFG